MPHNSTPFRKAILAKATPKVAADLTVKMPLVRMAEAAQTDAATKAIVFVIEQIADSVFSAFLGDQPVSGLRYANQLGRLQGRGLPPRQLAAGEARPCMVLSNMLTEVFKAVLPSNNPASAINPMHNNDPLLTKPLASIGAGNGILTGEASFSGNVSTGSATSRVNATVNRILLRRRSRVAAGRPPRTTRRSASPARSAPWPGRSKGSELVPAISTPAAMAVRATHRRVAEPRRSVSTVGCSAATIAAMVVSSAARSSAVAGRDRTGEQRSDSADGRSATS